MNAVVLSDCPPDAVATLPGPAVALLAFMLVGAGLVRVWRSRRRA